MKKLFAIVLVLVLINSSHAQFKIFGTVKADDGPLPSAVVIIKNTPYAVTTNLNGEFLFNVPAGKYQLQVKYLGFEDYFSNVYISDKDVELNIVLKQGSKVLASFEVISQRIIKTSAFTSSEVTKEDLEKNNLGQDLPYLLDQTPSVVVTSDAGNGVGYSGVRIRGTDPTRINVTINGIPVNDAESQGVYWVDFPDLASSVNSIQIQRGVGASNNGAGAFGGSINIHTLDENENAHFEFSNSFGSFNTLKNTINFGTGKLKQGDNYKKNYFVFDGRLSNIKSDGYIDRAYSNLKSFYLAGAYHFKNSNIRLVAFSGKEKTYQAWGGVPKDSLNANRKFNPYTYEDETDNYIQTNYQLLYNFKLKQKLTGNISLHYTKGAGYYEQFKEDEAFSSYGLENLIISNDTIYQTDLIRRLWLDNDFYGTVFSLNYNPNAKLNLSLGGGWNQYLGKHFGEIIWAQFATNSNIRQKYYENDATKTDFNTYLKASYWLGKSIHIIGDLQVRNINYEFLGFDNNLNSVEQSANLFFFNPKAGLIYYLPKNMQLHLSVAVANKEPNRNDYTQSTPSSRPKPEKLTDIEFGYKFSSRKFSTSINLYAMEYKDQLVLTGKINNVGAYNRQNIDESYRRGVEVEIGCNIIDRLNFSANATFSQNKVKNYVDYIDNYDTWLQDSVMYSLSDISFSPNVIVGANLNYTIKLGTTAAMLYIPMRDRSYHEINLAVLPKYVGKQFMDNTSSSERMLDAYLVCDARISYKMTKSMSKKYVALNFMLRNFLNELYSSNAWTYSYVYGGEKYTDFGYYPQAEINYMIGLTIGF